MTPIEIVEAIKELNKSLELSIKDKSMRDYEFERIVKEKLKALIMTL